MSQALSANQQQQQQATEMQSQLAQLQAQLTTLQQASGQALMAGTLAQSGQHLQPVQSLNPAQGSNNAFVQDASKQKKGLLAPFYDVTGKVLAEYQAPVKTLKVRV